MYLLAFSRQYVSGIYVDDELENPTCGKTDASNESGSSLGTSAYFYSEKVRPGFFVRRDSATRRLRFYG